MMLLGIEIGETRVQVAFGTEAGEIVEAREGEVERERGVQGILDWLAGETAAVIADTPNETILSGIGVGFSGPVDSLSGRVKPGGRSAGWEDFPLREWFESRFGLPTLVMRDSIAAGWAEYTLGAGRGARTMAYLNTGSGISAALVAEGRIRDGQSCGAGEIGRTLVTAPAEDGSGMQTQKLEALCSGRAIERRARARWHPRTRTPLVRLTGGSPSRLTCDRIADAARQGDEFARLVVAEAAEALGMAAGKFCSLHCPERMVIGGGVTAMGEPLFRPLREAAARHTAAPLQGWTQIVPARLGRAAVPTGALMLAGGELFRGDAGISGRARTP